MRYLCPHKIDVGGKDTKVNLFFRVLQPELNVRLVARCGNEILAQKKEFRVNPGEMCALTVDTAKLTGNAVTVEVVKED